MTAKDLKGELKNLADPKKAQFLQRFFKTGPGEYSEGDLFWGIKVPDQRKVAKNFKTLPLTEVAKLLEDEVHEVRLSALFVLVGLYEKAGKKGFEEFNKEEVKDFYLGNLKWVNNWDLVDSSAHKILGDWLLSHPAEQKMLKKLTASRVMWERRVAMIACYAFIKAGELDLPMEIAELLVDDKEDLMHKAVGWMLREVGKVDQKVLENFLEKHCRTMPRTMLRYAIEKFPADLRDYYLGRKEKK